MNEATEKIEAASALYVSGYCFMDPTAPRFEATQQALQDRIAIQIEDDTLPPTVPLRPGEQWLGEDGKRLRTIVYEAPFVKCDRIEDYRLAWKHFENLAH